MVKSGQTPEIHPSSEGQPLGGVVQPIPDDVHAMWLFMKQNHKSKDSI
jgi:hypothetical protein